MKKYLIIAGVLIFISMSVTIQVLTKKYKEEKAAHERLWSNNLELTAKYRQYTNLLYTRDEFIGQIQSELKSALESLKIKPKEITKIIYRTLTDIDTVDRPVYVDYQKTHWMIADTGKCFTWSGMAFLSDTTLKITRTDFNYSNSTVDYFYQSRPKKFLFIKYGKKKVRQVTVPVCGTTTEKVIEIVKE